MPSAPGLASTPATGAPPPPPASDSMRELQYTLERLRITEAHRVGRGERVLVAVIDSGVDTRHPELAGVVRQVHDAVGDGDAPHSHGTAMVGAIAARARLAGVAPAAEIIAIRAFSPTASRAGAQGTTIHIRRSLDAAEAAGARIVNMSFAGPRDPELGRALDDARRRGMVLIAATGNAGARAAPQFPAAEPSVIAVTATDATDRLFTEAVRGPHVAVAAPGVDVLVPAPNGAYDTSTGTSVAAAHVSGVAALLLQQDARLDGAGVRQVLTATARALTGVGPEAGSGLVDAAAAVTAVAPRAAAPVGQPVAATR
jgi:subtilisin family serine protease